MEDCIFCKIVRREIPAEIVFENENFLAFLDINPRSPGHVQVIPKEHYRWVWDVPNIGEYFETVRKVVSAQQKAFNTQSVWSRIQGDEVFHAHIWIFPNPEIEGEKMDFRSNAEKIRKQL